MWKMGGGEASMAAVFDAVANCGIPFTSFYCYTAYNGSGKFAQSTPRPGATPPSSVTRPRCPPPNHTLSPRLVPGLLRCTSMCRDSACFLGRALAAAHVEAFGCDDGREGGGPGKGLQGPQNRTAEEGRRGWFAGLVSLSLPLVCLCRDRTFVVAVVVAAVVVDVASTVRGGEVVVSTSFANCSPVLNAVLKCCIPRPTTRVFLRFRFVAFGRSVRPQSSQPFSRAWTGKWRRSWPRLPPSHTRGPLAFRFFAVLQPAAATTRRCTEYVAWPPSLPLPFARA